MKAIRVILACIRTADKTFNLINDGDKICLGISGGKDSMAMFYALHLYKKFSKTKFEIYPCIIDLGFDDFSPKIEQDFAKKLGYELYVADGKTVYPILKIQKEKQNTPHLPCSICSKMKKAIINKVAHKLGCNKVAFAHHRDDAIETLFLNEIYGGRISTFSPKMTLSREDITFIRPLVLSKEEDLKRLCEEENIPVVPSHCPNDKFTKRETIKNILKNIYEEFPSSQENFLNMMFNNDKEDIFYSHVEHKIEGTNLFFKTSIFKNDLIDEIKFLGEDFKNFINKDSIQYLLYKKDEINAVVAIKSTNESRTFMIDSYKFTDEKDFIASLKELCNIYYERFNPCKLIIKNINKREDENIFLSIGFSRNSVGLYTKEISKESDIFN
jgi:tRNA 2-thiocytidine biosynthesis protein TtcA